MDLYLLAANRVNESQFLCVQCLPPERPQYFYNVVACTLRQCQSPAISLIADQGVTAVRKVHPYLVSTACFQLHPYIGVSSEALQEPIVRYGLLAGVGDVHS